MKSRYALLLICSCAAAACSDAPTEPPEPTNNFQPGEEVTLNTSARCMEETPRSGRVAAVSEHAIVIADLQNPNGGYTDAEYADFAAQFDEIVWPLSLRNFGEPSDIDRNGRVLIFFTSAVNSLSEGGSGSYVGGFFWAGDLFPRQSEGRLQGCEHSNEGEMFYMAVPDANLPRDRLRTGVVSTLAHEFQHLINASRRLRTGDVAPFEEIWLNEALSHTAEELVFYESSGLAPRRNIDSDAVTPVLEHINRHQVQNLARLSRYLASPEDQSPFDPAVSLGTRGAIWQFIRYAADLREGSEDAFWRGLVDSGRTGLDNLGSALGGDPWPWFRDWTVALYADGRTSGLDARYRHASWDFRSVLPRLRTNDGQFPLKTRSLGNGTTESITLRAGSATFVEFGVAGVGGEIRVANGELDASVSCSTGGTPVSLSVGEVFTARTAGSALLCFDDGSAGGEFALIPFYRPPVTDGVPNAAATLALNVSGRGLSARRASSRNESPAPVPTLEALARTEPDEANLALHPDDDFHRRLREREIRELTPRIRGVTARDPQRALSATAAESSPDLFISVVRTR